MSVPALLYSIDHLSELPRSITPADKLVLIALANLTNSDNLRAWPSVDRIARDCGINSGAVRRSLRRLEACGAIATDRAAGRVSNQYTLTGFADGSQPAQSARQPAQSARQSSYDPDLDQGGKREDSFQNGGEDEKQASHAPATDAAAAGLPDAVIAAWRWPLTQEAAKGLANDVRAYSESEVLTALEIMAAVDQKRPIARPGRYLKTVLQDRVNRLVPPLPAAAGAPDFAEVATQTAAHRQPVPRPEPHPAPAAAGGDDDHAAEVQAAFERALKGFHPVTQQTLAGARCTNGDGFTVHLPPEKAGRVAFLEQRRHEIAGGMAAELRRPMREAVRFVVAAG